MFLVLSVGFCSASGDAFDEHFNWRIRQQMLGMELKLGKEISAELWEELLRETMAETEHFSTSPYVKYEK